MISISERRSRTWTLELDNGEDNELKDIALQTSGRVCQVWFLALKSATADGSGQAGYRVYYGASGQPMPPSDFTDVLWHREEPIVSDATLSAQQNNPHWDPSGTPFGYAQNWGLVYKIIMAAAALAVFVILLFSVKKIDKVEG